MIKIIISGTSNGFSPRYSSDGILDDSISLSLLDRRRFLSRESDRLEKEGYCFQQLDKVGILFHKILLLYDGFGRDGFMMASLFIPKNEFLTGIEIKEALDSIVKDYKTRTINGMANFDLDWSFVKQKADELNKNVQNIVWTKLPAKNDDLCTALIKGADNLIADYFQYPNPLHKGFTGFGLVFLSETILDFSKESADGYQGYKVLTTEDVDIANPEYQIVLNGLHKMNGSFDGEKRITKKELLKNGNIRIGTYSKPGYRTADVYIKDEEKISKDNLTISVTLPTLIEKKTKVEITVIDTSTGNSIPDYIIKWKNTISKMLLPQKQDDGAYIFSGESCDTKWSYVIDCGKSYNCFSDEIDIKDGKNVQITKKVNPIPLWSIDYVLPNGDMTAYKIGISNDSIKQWVKHAKEEVELNGYDVEKIQEDDKSLKVTLYCKEHAVESFAHSEIHGKDQKSDDVIVDAVPDVTHNEEKANFPELKRDKYCLKLNERSRNFPVFKSYSKKRDIEKEISESLQCIKDQQKKWKNFCNQYENLPAKSRKQWENNIKQTRELLDFITRIIGLLENFEAEEAEKELNSFSGSYFDTGEGRQIHYKITDAIDRIKRYKSIPDVVVNPKDITYNNKEHQLECDRSESPSSLETIEFSKDRYIYSISNPIWQKEGTWTQQMNVVNKKLLPKYNVIRIAIPIVAILAIVICVFCLRGNGESSKKYEQYKANITAMLDDCNKLSYNEQLKNHSRYIGDSTFNNLRALYDNVNNFIKENKEFEDSIKHKTSYIDLENCFYEQTTRQQEERTVYDKCCQLLESSDANFNDCQSLLNDPVLSKEHFDELNSKYNQKINSLYEDTDRQAIKNEQDLYNKILSPQGTLVDGKIYMDTYSQVPMNGYTTTKRMGDVSKKMDNMGTDLYNKAMNDKLSKDDCINACNRYIQFKNYFKGLSYSRKITERLNSLNKVATSPSSAKTEVERSSISGDDKKEQITTLPDLFKKIDWDGVKGGVEAFDKKYSLSNSLIKDKNWIFTLVKNKKVKKGQYKNIYREIKNDSKINEVDKVNELAKRIQKIQ